MTKWRHKQPLCEYLFGWAVQNKGDLNLKAVLCTGDLVEYNQSMASTKSRYLHRGMQNGNMDSEGQWKAISDICSRQLDGFIPYIFCTGNHDYGHRCGDGARRFSQFGRYFPANKNPLWNDCVVEMFPNYDGVETLENAIYRFDTDTWGTLYVMALEFAPRDEVLEWADKKLKSSRLANSRVVLITHSIIDGRGEFIRDRYSILAREGREGGVFETGKAIWEKVIKPNKNVVLAICGHAGPNTNKVEVRPDGSGVLITMFNMQGICGWGAGGGELPVEIIEFKPDGETISFRTFYPLYHYSPKTREKSFGKKFEYRRFSDSLSK